MATDPVAKELEALNRTLREILSTMKDQNRALKTINHNLLELFRKPSDTIEPAPTEDEAVVVPPVEDDNLIKIYGWSMAALVQRENGLFKGDIKIEQDESRWVWTDAETWERVEPPSGQT